MDLITEVTGQVGSQVDCEVQPVPS